MIVVSAMRLVTGGATLLESRLMVDALSSPASAISLWQPRQISTALVLGSPGCRLACGLWQSVQSPAAPGCWNFGRLDQLGFVVVAGHAQRLGVGLRQHHFSVLGRRMADFALLVGEWRMGEFRHQLGRSGLVRIVAAHAIGRLEGLILVRLLQVGVLYVVAIEAKRRRRLGEMKVELGLADLPCLVRDVAGVAAHVEGGVAAAFLGNVHAGLVATQAKILFLIS